MILIPTIVMSAAFVFFLVSIFVILIIIKKIGMTILAKKLNINNCLLLWVPGLGSLYEGKLMNQFLKYGKSFEIAYFLIITIIKIIWLVNFFFGPSYTEDSFDMINSIINDIWAIIILIDIVFKIITLKNSGYKTLVSSIICIFLQPFWCYFVYTKYRQNLINNNITRKEEYI